GRQPHLSLSAGGEVEGCGRGRVPAANVQSGWVHPRHQGGRSPSARGKPLLHRCAGKFHLPSHRHNCLEVGGPVRARRVRLIGSNAAVDRWLHRLPSYSLSLEYGDRTKLAFRAAARCCAIFSCWTCVY
ncbi:unnamed protein product, partial [Ectocarpus sp. 4 AP-2014]